MACAVIMVPAAAIVVGAVAEICLQVLGQCQLEGLAPDGCLVRFCRERKHFSYKGPVQCLYWGCSDLLVKMRLLTNHW